MRWLWNARSGEILKETALLSLLGQILLHRLSCKSSGTYTRQSPHQVGLYEVLENRQDFFFRNKIFVFISRYYVSSFAYKLLGKMMVDPLFKINYLNPSLYRRVKQLDRCKQARIKLLYLKDFLFNCRFATK